MAKKSDVLETGDFALTTYAFTYKHGGRIFGGTVDVAPSNFRAARTGDERARRTVRFEVQRALRMQGSGFMSKVAWCKIKWVE